MAKLLCVEDDIELARTIQDWLELEGHMVETAASGSDALALLGTNDYELIVLDINLPDGSGIELCRSYRRAGGSAAVIFLTGRDSVEDKVIGLDSGADDYLTKPFHTSELVARVRALLRRASKVQVDELIFGAIRVDTRKHLVFAGEEEVRLSPQEFSLLEFFLRHPDEVFSAETLMQRVWSSYSEASIQAVKVAINRLRSKLKATGEEEPVKIVTVHGVGYRLSGD